MYLLIEQLALLRIEELLREAERRRPVEPDCERRPVAPSSLAVDMARPRLAPAGLPL